jgi:DNA-binding transcriptional MerR regulator
MPPAEIPNRSLFRQPEVCEIASIQPYVLRSWEAEFPDLGVARTEGGPRVYRKADVERVLRIKHLLFVEGLTLAGARRKLADEQPSNGGAEEPGGFAELLGRDIRERILQVKHGLRSLAGLLSRAPGQSGNGDLFELQTAPPRRAQHQKPSGKHNKRRRQKKKK